MPQAQDVLILLGLIIVVAPLLLTIALGMSSLLGWQLAEDATARSVSAAIGFGLAAAVVVLATMLYSGVRHVAIDLGDWVAIPGHYHFSVKFIYDRLSVPFAILSFVLSGTIGAFATRYMHRERGFNRFFVLYAIFLLGMVATSLAGTIETLFAGWELVGLSSALLVAFFKERAAPSRNGLWVWVIYRVSDASLLLAALVLHHLRGEGDFDKLLGGGTWPAEVASVSPGVALAVGLLLVVAAAGKSALVPFSGWLPRAMEGPTPSGALLYGALSVHLGAFLLLRVSPMLDRSVILCVIIVVLGLTTAVFAYLACGVQTDIKSALSFASLSQVGLIVAEIGLGLRYIALVHILGHACLRTLQFLRAPTLLHDYHTLDTVSTSIPPPLAVCFVLTGLASVGFPGTLGFISTELLVDSAVGINPSVGFAVVAAAALNGIAVMRAYFLLFTGARHVSTVSLGIGIRERIAILTLAALILGGGLYPQPGIATRERASVEILEGRARR